MPATHRDVWRAWAWLNTRGRGLVPTDEAFALLADRLHVRRRAALLTVPPLLAALVACVVFLPHPHDPPGAAVVLALVPLAVFTVWSLSISTFIRGGDARAAAGLTRRTTRPGAVGARTVFGPVVVALLTLAAVGHVGVLVVLTGQAGIAVATSYAFGVIVVVGFSAHAVRVVLRRPTIATDGSSLAIDERLRAADAATALWPVFSVGLALATVVDRPGSPGSHAVTAIAAVVSAAGSLLWLGHAGELGRFVRWGEHR